MFLPLVEQSVQNAIHSCGISPVQLWVGISSFFVRHYGNKSAYPEWLSDLAEWCWWLSVTSPRSRLALPSPHPQLFPAGSPAMQDLPRRCSALPFLSSFFQGRRHSSSDPILQQGRRGSATQTLSSSSLQVMVAVASVSSAERNPTCLQRKSKALFLLKDCQSFEFKFRLLTINSTLYLLLSVMLRASVDV